MKRPPDKQPIGYDKDGRAFPMILSPALVEEARELYPNLWIVANQPIRRFGWEPV